VRTITLNTIKDCGVIRQCGEYVIACGKKLWIFRDDGNYVSKSETIRYPGKLIYLPPDKIFVEDGANYQYRYVDLPTGKDIWTTTLEQRRMIPSRRFVASPDQSCVFDIYYHYSKKKWYVEKFLLHNKCASKVETPDSFRSMVGAYVDDDGILYVLQTQHATEDGKLSQNGILRIDWRSNIPIISWDHQWQSERGACWLDTDGDYILCNDYSVIDMKTLKSFSLLENDPEWNPQLGFLSCDYVPERNLLITQHGMYGGNVIIDCNARKRVAQYAPPKEDTSAGYAGCLIGDDFWIGTETGIIKKPFPQFEPIVPATSPYWRWAKEMEVIRGNELEKQQ